MRHLTLARSAAIALLAAAFPVASALSVSSPTPSAGQNALAALKAKGATEIDRRLQNLAGALDKLSNSTTLTAADKAALTKQLNDEVSGLTALKTKLAAETTVAGARADVQSIVLDYRVYALMLPKTRMMASADRFAVVETKLTKLHDELAAKATSSADKSKLADMSSQIANASAQTTKLETELLALQPTDYNANHAVLVTYRAAEKTAHDALVAARDDAKTVIDDLKSAKK
jgi:hypothetical protein